MNQTGPTTHDGSPLGFQPRRSKQHPPCSFCQEPATKTARIGRKKTANPIPVCSLHKRYVEEQWEADDTRRREARERKKERGF